MGTYRTKSIEVEAVKFEQHRRPWPEVVEPVYSNGIPEPRLQGGPTPVRNGDFVVAIGNTLFTLPPAVFARLFQEGPQDNRLEEALKEIRDLEARLWALSHPEPDVSLSPDVLPEGGTLCPGTSGTSDSTEGGRS